MVKNMYIVMLAKCQVRLSYYYLKVLLNKDNIDGCFFSLTSVFYFYVRPKTDLAPCEFIEYRGSG